MERSASSRRSSLALGACVGILLATPLEARAAEPEPSPASTDSVGEPQTAPAPAQARPEPPKGKALYGAGIFGVCFGIFNIGYGIPLSIAGPGDAYFSGYIPIAFGVSFIALGAAGIHHGKRRRKVWKTWAADPTAPPPTFGPKPPHVPWLIVGGVTTPLALATIGLMIPEFTDPVLNPPQFAYWVMGWGGVSAAAGIAMLAIGGAKFHHARSRDKDGAVYLQLSPTGWARRESFGFGVAGRF